MAVLIPIQLYVGHLAPATMSTATSPAKFAAIEARWTTEQPAAEVLIGIPDEAGERNLLALSVPKLGSFIASGTWDLREVGLDSFHPRTAAGGRPVLRLPHHGRHGAGHARRVVARPAALGRAAGDEPVVPLGGVPVVSQRVRRRAGRLVHGRGRPPTVGGLWPAAHAGRGDTVPRDEDGCRGVAGHLRPGLCQIYAFGIGYIYKLLRDGPATEAEPEAATPARPLAMAAQATVGGSS